MGVMIKADGGNAPANRADKDAGRLVAERYGDRRRDAQTGENLYAPVFSSRGVLRSARGFLCADSPGDARLGSGRKNRREAGGFLRQREMSSIATGRVTTDKMVPVE